MAEALSWTELESSVPGPFQPVPHYDQDSDSLSIFIKDDESYRERIDPLLTVYRSLATNQVVGCHIKHVKKILSTCRAFKLGVKSKDVTIGLLLMGLPLAEQQGKGNIFYQEYREIVEPIAARVGETEVSVGDPAIIA